MVKAISFRQKLIASIILTASVCNVFHRKLNRYRPNRNLLNHIDIEPMIAETKPSHVQLCRQVVARLDPSSKGKKIEQQDYFQETIETCQSPSQYHALVRIFSSAMVSQSAKALGLNLFYQHHCDREGVVEHGDDGHSLTVQMNLQPNLSSVFEEGGAILELLDRDSLQNICSRCVKSFDKRGGKSTDCSIFSERDMQKVIPAMVENVKFASINPSTQPTEMDMADTENHHRKLLSNPKSDAPSHDGEDVAVVYLDEIGHHLSSSPERDLMAIPLYNFVQHIPRSVTNVHIITTSNCERIPSGLCIAYAQTLHDYIRKFAPRSEVSILRELDSQNALRVTRVASTLICPPGMACLLPALARDPNISGKTIVAMNDQEYPWLDKLPQEMIHHVELLPSEASQPLKSINQKFLKAPPPDRSICPLTRGRLGSWIKDNTAAKSLQYNEPLDHIFGFADQRFSPRVLHPHRDPASYKWDEDQSLDSCPMEIQNHDTFCKTMKDLDISRLFFVGDYVGMNQAYSLWKILGHQDTPKPITETQPNWMRDVVCPHSTIRIQFIRNDMMVENDVPVDLPNEVANCGVPKMSFCYKWTDEYMQYYNERIADRKKTLMVTSFGPHYYSEDTFSNAMSSFFRTVQSSLGDRLGQDYVFYRTSTPGHESCNKKDSVVPFKNFEEYRPTITPMYSWDLYDGFNDIASRMIGDFNRAQGMNGQTHSAQAMDLINILDVYPMTVLRRDGHLSGRDCRDCGIANNCFQYSLPGPPDFWNHLLFSNLADVAAMQMSSDMNRSLIKEAMSVSNAGRGGEAYYVNIQ